MRVLEVSEMHCGTKIQIEDWHNVYKFFTPGSTLAAYPKSKVDVEGQFAPKKDKTMRVSFNFPSNLLTQQAFNDLKAGAKQLVDFKEYINNPKKIECI